MVRIGMILLGYQQEGAPRVSPGRGRFRTYVHLSYRATAGSLLPR